MHHPTDRITHTTAFVTPVVEHWLEREIAQWVHPMKDRSDDPSHHERTLYLWATSRSHMSLAIREIPYPEINYSSKYYYLEFTNIFIHFQDFIFLRLFTYSQNQCKKYLLNDLVIWYIYEKTTQTGGLVPTPLAFCQCFTGYSSIWIRWTIIR